MPILLQYIRTNFQHKETNYTDTTLLLYLFKHLHFSRGILDVAVEALIFHSRITYNFFVCNSNLPALSFTILIHSSQFQPISPRIPTPLQGQDNFYSSVLVKNYSAAAAPFLHCVFEIPPQMFAIHSQSCLRLFNSN